MTISTSTRRNTYHHFVLDAAVVFLASKLAVGMKKNATNHSNFMSETSSKPTQAERVNMYPIKRGGIPWDTLARVPRGRVGESGVVRCGFSFDIPALNMTYAQIKSSSLIFRI